MKSLRAKTLDPEYIQKPYLNHFTEPFRNHSWKDRLFKAILDCHFFSAAQASIPVIYEELCGSLTECLPPTRLPEAMQLLGMNPTEQDVAWQILVSRIDRGKSCCYEESFLIPFYFLEAEICWKLLAQRRKTTTILFCFDR